MNTLWKTDIKTLQLFFQIIGKIEEKHNKKLNRNEREVIFLQLMKEKDIKPSGHTELNKVEFIKELVSKNKKILNIDSEGYKIIQKKEK